MANLTNNWITDQARDSVTAFAALTEDGSQTAQVFVDVVYTTVYYVTKVKNVYITETTESYITFTTESFVTWATESYSTELETSYVTLYGSAIKGVSVANSWVIIASMVLFWVVDMLF